MPSASPQTTPEAQASFVIPIVDRVQALIEELYDVVCPVRVGDFLVDEEVRRKLPGAQLHLPEQLFVGGAVAPELGEADEKTDLVDDTVDVALYVDEDILALLAHDDPFVRLHPGNLEPFCVLTEGVSHFVFLAWRLGAGLDISALELELQAELDKFCACVLLLDRQPAKELSPQRLWRQLFVHYELQTGLSADEVSRYHTASRAAGRMARSLLAQLPARAQAGVLRGARSFCRRSLAEKLRGS